MVRQIKIVVEKHPDGYVAYPVGVKGVVVGQDGLGDAAGEVVFQHHRPDADPDARHWPAWSALWWVGHNGAPPAAATAPATT